MAGAGDSAHRATEDTWQRVDVLVQRFEEAWQAGQRPALDKYLPEDGPNRLAVLVELAHVDLERRLKAGEPACADEYLRRYPELAADTAAARQLLEAENALRRRQAAPPSTLTGRIPAPPSADGTQANDTPGPERLRCPHCHNPVQVADDDADEVLCPGCGSPFRVREARHTTSTVPMRPLGKFQLLERVGAGAFGAVWKARDNTLDRVVALKIPHTGLLTAEQDLERFLREARAAAQLRHPGIVSVHEVVTLDGLPVIAAEFVTGVTLKDLAEARKLTWREAAVLVAELAEALHYAHGMGVVHRDLKPANIMVGYGAEGPDDRTESKGGSSVGRPRVMDFGLARRPDSDATLTDEGHVLGTPAYMSPEQAAGKGHEADGRSDVYSLGVILYELLTGQLPFRGSKMMILAQVLNDEPRAPRRLQRGLPPDLDTICLKAMAKDPARRYATARALADDLHRFLEGRTIRARPAGAVEQAVKWARRRPATALLLLAITLLLLTVTVAAVGYASQQRHLADERATRAREQEQAHKETAAALYRSLLGQAVSIRLARQLGYRRRAWQYLHQAAELDVPQKNLDEIRTQVLACLGDPVGLEPVDAADATPFAARGELSPAFLGILRDVPTHPLSGLRIFAVTTDGSTLATATTVPGAVALWGKDGQALGRLTCALGPIHVLRFTPDGQILVAGCEEGCATWDVASRSLRTFWRGDVVSGVAVHPGGHLVVTTHYSYQAELWSLSSNRLITTIAPPAGVANFVFSADGNLLLGVSPTGENRWAWPVVSTPEKTSLAGHHGGVPGIAFSPDGRLLASVSKDRTLKVWDVRSGALLHTCRGHEKEVQTLAFRPDGKLLATGDWGGAVLLWDPSSGEQVGRVDASKSVGAIWRVGFARRGECLAAAGEKGMAVWTIRPAGGAVVAEQRGAPVRMSLLYDLAVHPNGNELALLDRTGSVFAYDLDRPAGPRRLDVPATSSVCALQFDSAGKYLWFPKRSGEIAAWDWSAGRVAGAELPAHRNPGYAMTADGRWVARCEPSELIIADVKTGQEFLRLPLENRAVWLDAWDPSGTRLAVAFADGGIVIWDLPQVFDRLAEFGIAVSPAAGFAKRSPEQEGATDPREALAALHRRAVQYRDGGRYDDAEPLFLKVLEGYRQEIGPDQPDTLNCMKDLAELYWVRGRFDDAEPLFRGVLEVRRRQLGADHAETLRLMSRLGVLYWRLKKFDQSIALFEEVLALQTRKLGADHPDTLVTRTNLGVAYRDAGRLDDGVRCFEQALAAARKHPGPLPAALAWLPGELTRTYERANRLDKAEAVYRFLLEQARQQFGADAPNATAAQAALASNLLGQGKFAEAEKALRDCLAVRQQKEPDYWATFNTQSMLGEALLGQKHYADAEPLLRAGYEGMKQRQAQIPLAVRSLRLTEAVQRLVRLYEGWGKKEEAARWRKELDAVKEIGPPPDLSATG